MSTISPARIALTITMDLMDMPAHAPRWCRNNMIPTRADVSFYVDGTALTFDRMELSGWIPLKTGQPSQRTISDAYWRLDEQMPAHLHEVVDCAQSALHQMMGEVAK